MRDRYYLSATGSTQAIEWLFPDAKPQIVSPGCSRHVFNPSPQPITVERALRMVCGRWQEHWHERLGDQVPDHRNQLHQTTAAPTNLKELYDYHQMRSTFASLALKSGRSAEEVARWLGHRDTRMVREHYAHLIDYDVAPDLNFLGSTSAAR